MNTEKEAKAIEGFERFVRIALDESKDAHHLGGNLGYLRCVFDCILNDYLAEEYATHANYNREISREERLRRDLKPRHKKSVLERDEYRCTNCGSHKNLCVDHKMPISRGGDNEMSNLQTLCRSCNANKGSQTMEEWRATK